MSYRHPTPHEIRISANLQKIAKRLEKDLERATGGKCHWLLNVSPAVDDRSDYRDMQDAPVASYVANSDRRTSALIMLELLAKWEANGELPPLHELRDDAGRSLEEILGSGVN